MNISPDTVRGAVLVLVQLVVVIALTPLLIGVMRQIRARLEGRVGAGVAQPWRDIRKLMRKEPLRAKGISPVQAVAPIVLMITSLMVCALVPLVGIRPLPLVPDDLFVVVALLLLGSAALALVGLDAGTAFGGMGSSRHMMISALVEPTVLVSVYALSIPVGTSALSAIVQYRLDRPVTVLAPVSVLAVVALILVAVAETGRVPVDNPSTHLELTMVHEAMVLESSGRDLAWLEVGSWLRLTALFGLVANLLAPWGVATEITPIALLIGATVITVKLTFVVAVVSLTELFLAKVRLFKVPELLAGSFVLAFLAVTASYLVA